MRTQSIHAMAAYRSILARRARITAGPSAGQARGHWARASEQSPFQPARALHCLRYTALRRRTKSPSARQHSRCLQNKASIQSEGPNFSPRGVGPNKGKANGGSFVRRGSGTGSGGEIKRAADQRHRRAIGIRHYYYASITRRA